MSKQLDIAEVLANLSTLQERRNAALEELASVDAEIAAVMGSKPQARRGRKPGRKAKKGPGRPVGSKNKAKKGPGRPKGSGKRGRPVGSKNKAKKGPGRPAGSGKRGRKASANSAKVLVLKALPVSGESVTKDQLASKIKGSYSGKSDLVVVVGQALFALKSANLVTNPKRGEWCLTKKGINVRNAPAEGAKPAATEPAAAPISAAPEQIEAAPETPAATA